MTHTHIEWSGCRVSRFDKYTVHRFYTLKEVQEFTGTGMSLLSIYRENEV